MQKMESYLHLNKHQLKCFLSLPQTLKLFPGILSTCWFYCDIIGWIVFGLKFCYRSFSFSVVFILN